MYRIDNPVARFAVNVATMMLAVILAVAIITATSGAPGHDELARQQEQIMDQLQELYCIALIHPDEHTPDAIASCQVDPDG